MISSTCVPSACRHRYAGAPRRQRLWTPRFQDKCRPCAIQHLFLGPHDPGYPLVSVPSGVAMRHPNWRANSMETAAPEGRSLVESVGRAGFHQDFEMFVLICCADHRWNAVDASKCTITQGPNPRNA